MNSDVTFTIRSLRFYAPLSPAAVSLIFALFVSPGQAMAIDCETAFSSSSGEPGQVAPAKNAEAPQLPAKFLSDYRLNSFLVAEAFKHAELRKRTQVLIELGQLIETLAPAQLIQLSETGQLDRPVSLDAMSILTEAIKALNHGRVSNTPKASDAWGANPTGLQAFIRRSAHLRKLPPFEDIVLSSPGIFTFFAAHLIGQALVNDARRLTDQDIERIYEENKSFVARVNASGVLEKLNYNQSEASNRKLIIEYIDAVTPYVRYDIQRDFSIIAYGVLGQRHPSGLGVTAVDSVPNPSKANSARETVWHNVGVDIIANISVNVGSHLAGRVRTEDVRFARPPRDKIIETIAEVGIDAQTNHFEFLLDAIEAFYSPTNNVVSDPAKIQSALRAAAVALGNKLRKDIDDEVKKQKGQDKREVVTYGGKGKGQRVAQVSGKLLRTESKETNEPRVDERPISNLGGALELPRLNDTATEAVKGEITYSFNFERQQETGEVVIEADVLKAIDGKGQSLKRWISAFLRGPEVAIGSQGIKRIGHTDSLIWEIKLIPDPYRILVRRDKASRRWTWIALVHHNRVTDYIDNHGLRK